jgi:hypothetical protein
LKKLVLVIVLQAALILSLVVLWRFGCTRRTPAVMDTATDIERRTIP